MDKTFNKIHLIRQVDLFTLKLFLTAVEERQIGRAALRENIAGSAATKRIQDLEEIVGTQLFERTPRGVIPTPAGLVLARHTNQIFNTLEDIRHDLNEFKEGVRGSIRVASTGGIITQFLASEIAEYARDYPLIDIDLKEYANPEVIRALAAGEVDAAVFVDGPEAHRAEISAVEFRRSKLVAVVSLNHPLAERKQVKVTDLLQYNLIAIAPSTTIMALVRQTAENEGMLFEPKYSVSSVYAATSLVRVNQGITIQPEGLLLAQDLEWVRTVSLDEPWAERRLCVGTFTGRAVSVATQSFVDQLLSRSTC